MRNMNKWEVWFAKVYYEDDPSQSKKRPVVIISVEPLICIALKITTHEPRKFYYGEYSIKNWKAAGLVKPSVIRVSQKYNLIYNDFLQKLGRLSPEDILHLSELIKNYYT